MRHVSPVRARCPSSRSIRLGAGLLLVVLATVVVPGRARAHPFGPPPTMTVEVAEERMTLQWQAAGDDLAALAGALGLVAASQTFVYDADGNLESGPPPEAEQLAGVASAPELDDYLASHVAVRTADTTCPVAVDSGDFPDHVRYEVDCPGLSSEVELQVTLLQDLHPAYRTVATATASGDRVVLTGEEPAATLAVAAATADPAGTNLLGFVILGLAASTVVAGAWWLVTPRRSGVRA